MHFAHQDPAAALQADDPLAAQAALTAPRRGQEPGLAPAPLVSEDPTNTLQHRPPDHFEFTPFVKTQKG